MENFNITDGGTEIQKAFDLGRQAYLRGKVPMPNIDKDLMALIGDRIEDNSEEGKLVISSIMDQWSNGWATELSNKKVTAVFSRFGMNQFVISVSDREDLTEEKIRTCVEKHYNRFRHSIKVEINTATNKVTVHYSNTPEITMLDWTFLPNY